VLAHVVAVASAKPDLTGFRDTGKQGFKNLEVFAVSPGPAGASGTQGDLLGVIHGVTY